jgi:hypothetical protein
MQMTDSSPARPSDRNVARFRQFKQTRVHRKKNGALLTAVTGEIGLRITIDIELAHHSPSRDRRFPDCGSDRFAVPCHVARKADVY